MFFPRNIPLGGGVSRARLFLCALGLKEARRCHVLMCLMFLMRRGASREQEQRRGEETTVVPKWCTATTASLSPFGLGVLRERGMTIMRRLINPSGITLVPLSLCSCVCVFLGYTHQYSTVFDLLWHQQSTGSSLRRSV